MNAKAKILLGASLLFGFLFLALFSAFVSPFDPAQGKLEEQLLSPSIEHPFGQNHHGQDILSRVIYGSRVSLLIGVLVVFISGALGTFLGLFAGYYRGFFDRVLSRVVDTVLAFPGVLLAIALAAALGPSIQNVVIALVASGWVPFARVVRAQTLSLRKRQYVLAAKSIGVRPMRILFRHILPNLGGILIVQATFALAAAILAESSLSFLGLGVSIGTPSWGAAMSDGVRYMLVAPHMAIFPGIAILLSVLALNLLGDGLRDFVNDSSLG